MRLRSVLPAGALLIAALPLGSCKQQEGDRCNLDSDCASGLFCCVLPSKRAEGGKCLPTSKCELTPTDSGPSDAKTEGKTDATPAVDGKQPPADLGTPDHPLTSDVKATPDSKPQGDAKPVDLAPVH